MSTETLMTQLDARGVLFVKLNRPEVRNAFNDKVIAELHQVFLKEAMDSRVRAVVLSGKGSVFCAGGDLNWMKKSVEMTFEQNLDDTRKLAALFKTLNEFPKPLIGAIHGAAIGGGVGLVSVCDIAIASTETQFSLSEVRLGIVPACIGPFVVAKIGASHARGLFMSAERFTAQRAYEIGLVHEVVRDSGELDAAVEKNLGRILECGPCAMGIAKKLVLDLSWPERREEIADPLEYVARSLAEVRTSPEGQEGVKAFLEKRKPQWLKK